MAKKPQKQFDPKASGETKDIRIGKGRRYVRKDNRKKVAPQREDDTSKWGNDPQWYAMDRDLLTGSANLPYSFATGTPIDLGDKDVTSEATYYAPGICTIYVAPSLGGGDQQSAAVNVASESVFAYIRKDKSGYSNYNATDLMIYLLAMSSVYSFINFAQRVYGIAQTFSQRNRYYPNGLLIANFMNPTDVLNNMAKLRYGINMIINKAASFAVPANLPIFARHSSLFQDIYTEGTSVKDQLYMYAPMGFWEYQHPSTSSDDKGFLAMRLFCNKGGGVFSSTEQLYTVEKLLQYGNNLIDRLIADEDFKIMNGDIMTAYGTALMKLVSVPDTFLVVPKFDITILEQMHNATLLYSNNGYAVQALEPTLEGWQLYQSSQATYLKNSQKIKYPAETHAKIASIPKRLLVTTTDQVTPEVTMDNSRLTLATRRDAETVFIYSGSEVALACAITIVDPTNELGYKQFGIGGFTSIADLTSPNSVTAILYHFFVDQYLAPFKFAPNSMLYYDYFEGSTGGKYKRRFAVLALDNYTIVDNETLKQMHEAALINELHVPTLGKLAGIRDNSK